MAGSGSSWATGRFGPSGAASSTPSSAEGEYVARHLVLRGWATWEEKQTKGARREEDVLPFMVKLRQVLPQVYSVHLGEPKLFGARNVKVLLPVTPGMAWELRGVVLEAIEEHDLVLAGVRPRVMV